ncbi:hypothetical protein RF11_07302 [Thelohanellus kitauei]|uniref:Uncharacterized protein n=1 Tax=Thelohanellus kitauei TaxID=669202 RepID=A0A0C2MUF9_THEKT|nr:hypothetical protein RF11_07302 [Thelohanellus kitauei]
MVQTFTNQFNTTRNPELYKIYITVKKFTDVTRGRNLLEQQDYRTEINNLTNHNAEAPTIQTHSKIPQQNKTNTSDMLEIISITKKTGDYEGGEVNISNGHNNTFLAEVTSYVNYKIEIPTSKTSGDVDKFETIKNTNIQSNIKTILSADKNENNTQPATIIKKFSDVTATSEFSKIMDIQALSLVTRLSTQENRAPINILDNSEEELKNLTDRVNTWGRNVTPEILLLNKTLMISATAQLETDNFTVTDKNNTNIPKSTKVMNVSFLPVFKSQKIDDKTNCPNMTKTLNRVTADKQSITSSRGIILDENYTSLELFFHHLSPVNKSSTFATHESKTGNNVTNAILVGTNQTTITYKEVNFSQSLNKTPRAWQTITGRGTSLQEGTNTLSSGNNQSEKSTTNFEIGKISKRPNENFESPYKESNN